MQYESVILDLLTRVMKLEEEVRQLSEKLNQLEQLPSESESQSGRAESSSTYQKLTDEQLEDVKKLLDANGLKVTCLQSSLGKVHLPGKERLAESRRQLKVFAASLQGEELRAARKDMQKDLVGVRNLI